MYLLGYDIGSSSIKAALLDAKTGVCKGTAQSPEAEMSIIAHQQGWAEQNPQDWWQHVVQVTQSLLSQTAINPKDIQAIGIAYQMHGLVVIDKRHEVLRPAIIWCDSRAVNIGNKALKELTIFQCLSCLSNSPGNFTASKLKWVKEHEPELFSKIDKMMLPGDYIAMKLTGEVSTTPSGLSEGILWDYNQQGIATTLLEYYGIPKSVIPVITPTFSEQGTLSAYAARELGLTVGTPITYRAGDQPNNALSLNVLNPGEVAATAGTSGVIYAVTDERHPDPTSRINTFIHVNHNTNRQCLGLLLCINGAGIANSWLRDALSFRSEEMISYEQMNVAAEQVSVGSEGVRVYPFGNGAERILGNKEPGAHIQGLAFTRHSSNHLIRATQEGIVNALAYGLGNMKALGVFPQVIRAGHANMFLSPIFLEAFANTAGVVVELYDTDGAQGAARGAGIGAQIYDEKTAFRHLTTRVTIEPTQEKQKQYQEQYHSWEQGLQSLIS